MSQPKKTDDNDKSKQSRENLFQIMDGIIQQLNFTKKMFIVMIVTIMIIPPISICYYICIIGTAISI